jgi:predicted DCC family thiol-disulfide oxidoreductase YuxK
MPSSELSQDLIVYDGECLMCSSFVNFVVRHDRKKRFGLVTVQSALGRALYVKAGLSPDAMETNLTIVNGRTHVKLGAFAAAMNAIGWPWRILALTWLVPWPISDFLYDRIARNRLIFNRGRCPVPTPDVRARLVE